MEKVVRVQQREKKEEEMEEQTLSLQETGK